jgi:hypothetical protein
LERALRAPDLLQEVVHQTLDADGRAHLVRTRTPIHAVSA